MDSESIRLRWSKRNIKLFFRNSSRNFFSYFYDLTPSPFYEIVFFDLSYCALCIIGSYAVVDFMFFIFGVYFVEHLKFIQEKIRQLDGNSKKLSEIIELHKEACDYFGKLNKIFIPQVLLKFLSVAMFVCVCGFQLIEVDLS